MFVIDGQVHLPSDGEKGTPYGYTPSEPDTWTSEVAGSLGEDSGAVVYVTNREYNDEDEAYIDALEDRGVDLLRGYEYDTGEFQINFFGETEYSEIDEYLSGHSSGEEFADGVLSYAEDHREDDFGIPLSHPFSDPGGLLRGEDPDSDVFQALVEASEYAPVYSDQRSNFWLNEFRRFPWSLGNRLMGDRFGFREEFDIEEASNGAIQELGGTDAVHPGVIGYTEFNGVEEFSPRGFSEAENFHRPYESLRVTVKSGLAVAGKILDGLL